MQFESSDATGAGGFKRPHARKGFYPAQLMGVTPRQKKDGTPIEGKFGKQIVLIFDIYKEDKITRVLTDEGAPLTLGSVQNSEYKNTNEDDSVKLDANGQPTYRTAFTPKSRGTKVFMALGWVGPPAPLDTDAYLGKWVEVVVDDFDAQNQDGTTFKASMIKEINKFEEAAASSPSPQVSSNVTVPTTSVRTSEVQAAGVRGGAGGSPSQRKNIPMDDIIEAKMREFDQLLADGSVTKEGHALMVKSLQGLADR